jgi:membrane-bound lytic murein transglycosylase A
VIRVGFFGAVVALLLAGCAPKQIELSKEPFPVRLSTWEALEETHHDMYAFFEAFARSCDKLEVLKPYCGITTLAELKAQFVPVKIIEEGRMTGYYEPTLHGSKTRSARYHYPIYGLPEDLVRIDLGAAYPELASYRLRGLVEGKRVVPYPDHATIHERGLDAPILCYVDSRVDAFFLHIQGSGKVLLEEGGVLNVGYADQNGHPYRAIGRYMKEKGYLEAVSMQTIRAFLEQHPDKMDEILHVNPSYIFFDAKAQGATGALGVELVAHGSVAVDRTYIPLGMPLFIKTTHPKINPWVVAQDVGGAIRGAARVDYFFGPGEEAAADAGTLYAPIELFLLLPTTVAAQWAITQNSP